MTVEGSTAARALGSWRVGPVGFGAMSLSVEGRPSSDTAHGVVVAALESGVNLFDTADCYGIGLRERGHNEKLLRASLDRCGADRAGVLVGTKGGHYRTEQGQYVIDARPDALRAACDRSLSALGVDALDLYFLHRPDPRVPYAESVGTIAELQRAGKVRAVGVSNVGTGHLEQARREVEVVAVQNRLSVLAQQDRPMVGHCAALGIAYLAWAPLGGFGHGAGEVSRHAVLRRIAHEHGVTTAQVALAWLLALSEVVIPIPGTHRPETVRENVAAAHIVLSADDLASLDATGVRCSDVEDEA